MLLLSITGYPFGNFFRCIKAILETANQKNWLLSVCIVLLSCGIVFSILSNPPEPSGISISPLSTVANTIVPPNKKTPMPVDTATPMPVDTATPMPVDTATLIQTIAISTPILPRVFHVIAEGEYLWCIAQKYYGAKNGELSRFICMVNQSTGQLGVDCNELQIGEKVQIPTKDDYPWAPIPHPLPTPGSQNGIDYFCIKTAP